MADRGPVRRAVVALVVAVALVGSSLAASAQSLEQARRDRAEVQARLDEAAERLAELEEEAGRLDDERSRLRDQLAALEAQVGAANDRVSARVRELYKRGSADPVVLLLSGRDPDEALDRAATMSRLVSGDLAEVESATNIGTQVGAVADRLAESEAALAATAEEQRTLTDALQDDLARAQSLEARLEEEDRQRRAEEARRAAAEEERRAAAAAAASRSAPRRSGGRSSAPVSTGGKVCPVGRPHSFTDTWGAARSGGRRHRGTDILAPRGQDVYAIVGGVWDVKSYGASAGNWAILKGADGTSYWYLHLEQHLVGDGARVAAGQLVATNGDTGNARGTTPHVHFEQHPGGGGAVNPYPLLKGLCG